MSHNVSQPDPDVNLELPEDFKNGTQCTAVISRGALLLKCRHTSARGAVKFVAVPLE